MIHTHLIRPGQVYNKVVCITKCAVQDTPETSECWL